MNDRLFRRQFLLTPTPHEVRPGWTQVALGPHHVTAHPDLAVGMATARDGAEQLLLLGFMIDPQVPSRSSDAVLAALAESRAQAADVWHDELGRLSGRFVLLISRGEETEVYSDACGLRAIVYTWTHEGFAAASDTALLGTAVPLDSEGRIEEYARSNHFYREIENFLPADRTLYPAVGRLMPNHTLRTSSRTQSRFWPTRPLDRRDDWEVAATEAAAIFRGIATSARNQFPVALPLTSGGDSRMVLAACGEDVSDIYVYTRLYRDLQLSSADVVVPRQLIERRGGTHHVLDCRATPTAEWRSLFLRHSSNPHYLDSGEMAFGMADSPAAGRLSLSGTIAEIGRDAYGLFRGALPRDDTVEDILALVPGWSQIPFVRESIEDWFAEAHENVKPLGFDLVQLFHWEHAAGSWQAQSQLEWDLDFETLSLYGNRELLSIMLSVSPELRLSGQYPFQREILRTLSPGLLDLPINGRTRLDKVRRFVWRARRKLARHRVSAQRTADLLESERLHREDHPALTTTTT